MVKKRGIVWNYFTKKVHGSQITAFCKFCDQSYIQNATRMEKHIERCIKCPEDVKQDFMNAVRNKRAKSITMRLAENWSTHQSQAVQNDVCNERLDNLREWEYRDDFNNQIPDNMTNNSDIVDSKSWDKNSQVDTVQSEEMIGNRDWETVDRNREAENFASDEIADLTEDPAFVKKGHSSTRQLPFNPILQNKIQHEQYLERRALRRIAELEVQRKTLELQHKTLEFEKFQWEYQKEKTQSEMRWAHECRMMQLQEEQQHQVIEQHRNRTIGLQANQM